MSDTEDVEPEEHRLTAGVLMPLWRRRRVIVFGTLLFTVLTAAAAGGIYLFQPDRTTALLGFRPIFAGAGSGLYPNGLPFSPADINERTIIDRVFDQNHIEQYCDRDEFRSSVAVTRASTQLRFLDADYTARLADSRNTAADMLRLQEEYQTRRGGLSVQFELTFVRPRECGRLPPVLIAKALNDILQVWAEDVVVKRGVLTLQLGVLTPRVFEVGNASGESLLVRSDLVRLALVRAAFDAREIQGLPGAQMIRVGPNRISIAEIALRLGDLSQAMLDPLLSAAGRGLGRESARWVDEALKTALTEAKAAEELRQSSLEALHEYSGTPGAPGSDGRSPAAGSIRAQLNSSFIDKVVALSTPHTTYRQGLTERILQAWQEAIRAGSAAERFRRLKESLETGAALDLTTDEVSRRLDAVVADGKTYVAQMDALYEEYTKTSIRAAAYMYRIEEPARLESRIDFSFRAYLLVVLGVLLIAPLFFAAACLMQHYGGVLAKAQRQRR